MKQGHIIAAFKITDRFMDDTELPNDIVYALFRVRKIIQPQIEYQVKRQEKLIEKYKGVKQEDGGIIFENDEDRAAFDKAMMDLADTDMDIGKFEKIPFRLDNRCKLTLADIIVLDDFLEFTS